MHLSLCSGDAASLTPAALRTLQKLPSANQVRLASRFQSLPLGKSADLLAFKTFEPKTRFLIALVARKSADTQPLIPIGSDQIWAEATIQREEGNDFRWKESKDPKTLIHFTPQMRDAQGFWEDTRVYVMNCASDGNLQYFGWIDTSVTNVWLCRLLATLLCVVFYVLAAWGTFHIHRSQRVHQGKDEGIRHGVAGTNYASLLSHFNPVVLTAGSNGRGSATKLQIIFFSLLVIGLVSYIWMSTGYLSDLSSTILLLMGISGLGATASAATEVSKDRLDFDNWGWLINRGWLPKGGVAEANHAQWKDIIMTDGEFDVYRFQMITFSIVVGMALLQAGGETTDLSTFTIPPALLGVLGLSQAVYIAGKLAAPPSISELNAQIAKLRTAESNLQGALNRRDAGVSSSVATTVLPLDRADLKARVGDAYDKYIEAWDTTRTMFESTLSRAVSAAAEGFRPPFPYLCEPAEVMAVLGTAFTLANEKLKAAQPKIDALANPSLVAELTRDIAEARSAYEASVAAAKRGMAGLAQAAQAPRAEHGSADSETAARTKAVQEANVREALDMVKRRVDRLNDLNEAVKRVLAGPAG